MKLIMFALHDYRNHMTDEGWQLQEGLRLAGVTLCGKGYDGLLNVPAILDRYQPDAVVIADPRDWTAAMGGAFDKGAEFTGLEALRDVPTAVVFKDAANSPDFQRGFQERVQADALICYYHPRSVCACAPWVTAERIIRTHHSVDADAIPEFTTDRRGAIVSGARNAQVYPLRELVIRNSQVWGVDVLPHPGYNNRGSHTPAFYATLNDYKVCIATASRYGFALRKIIEGAACGCVAVTDLPVYDALPHVERGLVRVEVRIEEAIAEAAGRWVSQAAWAAAEEAKGFYDYRAVGRRLYADLERRLAHA